MKRTRIISILLVGLGIMINAQFYTVYAASASIKPAVELASTQSEQQDQSQFFLDEYKDPTVMPNNRSIGISLFGFIWKLALVIGLIYATIYVLRLLYGKKVLFSSELSNFNIIDTFYLKPNQALYIVEIFGKYLVLGVTSQSISLVYELSPEEVKATKKIDINNIKDSSFQNKIMEMVGLKRSSLDTKLEKSSTNILNQINKIAKR